MNTIPLLLADLSATIAAPVMTASFTAIFASVAVLAIAGFAFLDYRSPGPRAGGRKTSAG